MDKKLLKEQAEMFGIENRINQCQEECAELIVELSKAKRYIEGDSTLNKSVEQIREGITEEMADVELLLDELKIIFNNSNKVKQIKQQKLIRTKQRLEKNKCKQV